MRLLLVVALFGFSCAAQEPAHAPESTAAEHSAPAEHGGAEHKDLDGWKWANFAILAAALGYMLNKALPPFFKSRTAEIQKDIAEAARLKAEAEQQAAEIERRMATLGDEVAHIREEARAAAERESERLIREAEQQVARIQAQAEQEIAAMTKHATEKLKAQAAELALELAESRVRERINPAADGVLVDQFVNRLSAQGVRN